MKIRAHRALLADGSGIYGRATERFMKPNQLYLRCSCYSEVLVLDYWNDKDGELCVSIYSMDYRRSWLWRLKLAWHILTGGDNHSDQIVLSKEDAQKVREWLNQPKDL